MLFLLGLPLDAGVPHIDEPEKAMMEELWVGVTPRGRSSMKVNRGLRSEF
jgi:hypothetical protein